MSDPSKGLYRKFIVTRTDGSSEPGGRHHGCSYFVLDVSHDEHALVALEAYAESCTKELPLLAADLRQVIRDMKISQGLYEAQWER